MICLTAGITVDYLAGVAKDFRIRLGRERMWERTCVLKDSVRRNRLDHM